MMFRLLSILAIICALALVSIEFVSNLQGSSAFLRLGFLQLNRTANAAGQIPEDASEEQVTPALVDFQLRCRAPGVLVCQGFDKQGSFVPARWPATGLYPAGDGVFRGTYDPTMKSSGNGSLRFEIPGHTPANVAGYWRQSFGRNFGESSVFYVQFRQRFSSEMLTNKWGDTTWKQVIFHNAGATCGDVELTTVQYYTSGIPMMYTDCGARGIVTNAGSPPYELQQGDYNCWYDKYNPKSCFFYPPNKWVTFYYRVAVGHWSHPDSTIEAWVSLDAQPYKQWVGMSNFSLHNANPGHDYDTLTLLPYMTNKDRSLDHPTAYTWYDELIISTLPISAPR